MKNERGEAASRRVVLQTGLMTFAAGLLTHAQAHEKVAQAQKIAQSAVQYQDHPKNGQMCSICVNFVAPNECKIVQGPIVPNGWCIAFAPKSG